MNPRGAPKAPFSSTRRSGQRSDPDREKPPEPVKHLLLPLLLVFGAGNALAAGASEVPSFYQRFGDSHLVPPGDQDQPFRGRIAAHVDFLPTDPSGPLGTPPAAFAPRRDGSVLLLYQHPPRLVVMRGDTVLSDALLQGPDFDPSAVALVDLLPFGAALPSGEDRVLLLDRASGTLWLSTLEGHVESRVGLFMGATQVRRGADGSILVDDPGNQAIAVFQPDLSKEFSRKGSQLFPASTRDGALAFLRQRKDREAVLVGRVPARGASPQSERLAVLPVPEGERVLDAQVVGCHGRHLQVLVLSAREGDRFPRSTVVWKVPASPGGGEPTPRRLPTVVNYSLDSGPELRLGPEGRLWRMVQSQDRGQYWILELEEGSKP